jgi:hypothetical protein
MKMAFLLLSWFSREKAWNLNHPSCHQAMVASSPASSPFSAEFYFVLFEKIPIIGKSLF